MRKRAGNEEIAIREFRWYASRSRYWAPTRRGPHTKAHKIRRYCIWRGTEGGGGGEEAIEVSTFSSPQLGQESMHLKFFFSAIYNITIVSDLIGSTYLITGYKLESEVRPDNWQWGRRRYFRKEREREGGSTEGEGERVKRKRGHARIIFKINRFTRIIYANRHRHIYCTRGTTARAVKRKGEERKGEDWRREEL